MTKEEIIKELNVCDFKDQSVLAALVVAWFNLPEAPEYKSTK